MSDATKNRIESMKRLIKHADTMIMLLQEMKTCMQAKEVLISSVKTDHIKQMNNVRYDIV